MTWFTAHVIIGMRKKIGERFPLRVYENIYLVEGTVDEALKKATQYAMIEVGLDDSFTIDGDAAERFFVGIRKLINVSNPDGMSLDEDSPTSGTELSYSQYEVADEESLKALSNGEEVHVMYIE